MEKLEEIGNFGTGFGLQVDKFVNIYGMCCL